MKARVKNGHLVLNEPTTLPEGMEVNLVIDLLGEDDGDDLSDEERTALHAALEKAWAEMEAGDSISAEQLIEGLRQRR